MWAKLASIILRNRLVIIVLLGVLTVLMGTQASKVQLAYDFAKVIPADDPDYVNYVDFKQQFGEDGNVLVVGIKDKRIFQLDFFNGWFDLAEDIEAIDGIQQVVSLTKIYKISRNDSLHKFEMVPAFEKKPETQAELDSISQLVLGLPFYEGLIHNIDSNVTLMAITLDKKKLDSKERITLVKAIENEAKAFGQAQHTEIYFSGLPYIRTNMSTKVAKELQVFTLFAMLITAIILLLFFRSFYAVIFPMLVVIIGVIWSLGTIHLLGYKITLLTGLIPPLIVVIGIPNCIYLLNKYHNEYKTHKNKIKALTRIIERIGRAALLTNLTTAVGFGVFYFTGSAILEEFGLVTFLNIMAIFVISIIIIPIVFSFLPAPTLKQTKHLDNKFLGKFVDVLVDLVYNHRRKIYLVALILIVAAFIGIFKVRTVGYIVDDLPKRDKVYQDLKFFERNFRGVMPFEVKIDTKKPQRIKSLRVLRKIDQLQDTLATYDELSRPVSVVEMIKFAKQAFYRGNPGRYSLPSQQEIGFILSFMPKGKGQDDLLKSLVDSNYQVARLSVQMADIGSNRMEELRDEIEIKIDSIFDSEEYDVQLTGTSLIYLKGNDYLIKSLSNSMSLAFLIIAVILFLLFTSFKMVIISLLPNTIPLILTLGMMGYFGIALKPSTVLIFSIAFGIAVDTAIHFLTKYRHELKHNNWNISRTVSITMRDTGVSMIYTSIVLFFGFVIFAASTFGGTVSLGLLTSITLIVALFCNLLLLPSLMLSLEKRINAKKELETSIIDIDEDE